MLNFFLDNGGSGVDKAAKQYMTQHPGTRYFDACKAVIALHTNTDEKDNKTIAIHCKGDATGLAQSARTPNINRLSDVVMSLPRRTDHSIDAQLATNVINRQFADLARSAAGDYLTLASSQKMGRRDLAVQPGINKTYGAMFTVAFKEVAQENSAVFDVYNTGVMTDSALRSILQSEFATTEPPHVSGFADETVT